jgi:hypothetical protein
LEAYSITNNIRPTAKKYGVQPKSIRDWKKNEAKLLSSKPNKKTVHKGPKIAGSEIGLEAYVREEIFRMANLGSPCTTSYLIDFALHKDIGFLNKNKNGEVDDNMERQRKRIREWVYRVLDKNHFSIRKPTHIAQNANRDVNEAMEFVEYVNQVAKDYGVTPDRIANMDQTNVDFGTSSRNTIVAKGTRTVKLQQNKSTHGNRATANLCVTASGEKLPAYVIFMGEPGGRIQTRELPSLNGRYDNVTSTVQRSAWASEENLLDWIKKVWKPFVQSKNYQTSILLLDDFSVHKMGTVSKALAELKTKVLYLPGGATSKIQVLDVGINKPFKDHLKEQASSLTRRNLDEGTNVKVNRELVMDWVHQAWSNIRAETILETWRHCQYIFD